MKLDINKRVAAELLSGDNAYATTLMAIALTVYGSDEFISEDPEVLFDSLEQEFSCELSEESKNRLQAAMLFLATDLFYKRKNVFISIIYAFDKGDVADDPADEEDIDGCTIAWGVFEAGLLDDTNPAEMSSEFSEGVSKYIEDKLSESAEDLDEVPDDVDTIAEAMDADYYMDYIKRNCVILVKQLKDLGAPTEELLRFMMENDIPVDSVL